LRRIARNDKYKILFQKTWQQPGLSRHDSIPVLVQAGKRLPLNPGPAGQDSLTPAPITHTATVSDPDYDGRLYELEGTLTVSLARYLHVDARLWYTLPEKVKLVMENNVSHQDSSVSQSEAPLSDEAQADNTALSLTDNDTPIINTNLPATDADGLEPLPDTINGTTGQPTESFSWIYQTAVMDTSRRMRSNELHYLDHPLFGVLIRITPIATGNMSEATVTTNLQTSSVQPETAKQEAPAPATPSTTPTGN
jgi:hypothetical protein